MKNNIPSRKRWPYLLAALVILSAAFLFACRERFVDPDEGAYLLAAKLVMQGKLPYSDFFWPQMSVLPYAYGIWMKLFGIGWYSARSFSALLGIAMGLLLFFHVIRLTGKQLWALLAVILFAFSSLSAGWLSTTKTYSLSTFFVFAAYCALLSDSPKGWKHFAAGCLLGLAISTRLYFIGLIPAFLWLIYRQEKKRTLLWKHAYGILLGLAPSFFFLLQNPDNFYFDNIGYHFLRSDYGFLGSLKQKMGAIPHLLGWGLTEGFIGLQFALLLVATAALFYRYLRARRKIPAAGLLTVFLIPLLFIPTPTHLQYFSSLLPFLILNAVQVINEALAEFKQKQNRPVFVRPALAAVFWAYILMGTLDFYQYGFVGRKVPGIRGGPDYAAFWKISSIKDFSRIIDENVQSEGEPVMSFWPGYLLESKATIFPGMENHSNVVISPKLRPSEQEKYRIVAIRAIFMGVLQHRTRLVILEVWDRGPGRKSLEEALKFSGFARIMETGGKEVYKWSGKT